MREGRQCPDNHDVDDDNDDDIENINGTTSYIITFDAARAKLSE